jgi:hypothetical protein
VSSITYEIISFKTDIRFKKKAAIIHMTSSFILHPIFEECKRYTLDPYWQDIFSGCAKNNFPMGIRYDPVQKNIMIKKDAKKPEVISLPTRKGDTPNAAQLYKVMMQIFKEKLHMRSSRDLQLQKEDMDELCKKNIMDLDCEWKDIKPKHLKDQLLLNYIYYLKQQYNLSPVEIKQAMSTIQLGFQFKSLLPSDVEFSGTITNIKGLSFDEEKRIFSIPIKKTPTQSMLQKNSEKPSTHKFHQLLDKFIRDYNAKSTRRGV